MVEEETSSLSHDNASLRALAQEERPLSEWIV